MFDKEFPFIITTIVVTLLILAVGVFAFFVVTSEVGYNDRQTETFAVTDPTVSQSLDLEWKPETIVLVQQYNGFEWVTVSSSYYSVSDSTVTVLPAGLQG